MRALLRHAAFRRLLAGWSVGNFADSVLYLTLAIWAKELTGSSTAAGLIFLTLAAPVLLAPVIGLIADRTSRKRLLVVGNLIAAAVTATLVLVQRPEDIWLLYVVTFAYGTLGYLNGSAQGGLVRDLLPSDQLGAANSLLVTIDQGLRVLTPAVGAALYVLWGGHALALSVSGTLVVAAGLLALVRVTESPSGDAVAVRVAGHRSRPDCDTCGRYPCWCAWCSPARRRSASSASSTPPCSSSSTRVSAWTRRSSAS